MLYLTDRIISAIDEGAVDSDILKACSSARADLVDYRNRLDFHIREFQQAQGIELRVNDLELTKLAVNEYDRYCVVFDLDKEKFDDLFHPYLRAGAWTSNLHRELMQGQSEVESEVEVLEHNGKICVFLESEQAANVVIGAYLQRKKK